MTLYLTRPCSLGLMPVCCVNSLHGKENHKFSVWHHGLPCGRVAPGRLWEQLNCHFLSIDGGPSSAPAPGKDERSWGDIGMVPALPGKAHHWALNVGQTESLKSKLRAHSLMWNVWSRLWSWGKEAPTESLPLELDARVVRAERAAAIPREQSA